MLRVSAVCLCGVRTRWEFQNIPYTVKINQRHFIFFLVGRWKNNKHTSSYSMMMMIIINTNMVFKSISQLIKKSTNIKKMFAMVVKVSIKLYKIQLILYIQFRWTSLYQLCVRARDVLKYSVKKVFKFGQKNLNNT